MKKTGPIHHKNPKPYQEGDEPHREFLFKAFHDMRNPLHAIMGYTRLVLKKTREQIPQKHRENLEKVIESAERLNEIINQMVERYRKK